MLGNIYLKNLEVECIVGIHQSERVNPQKIYLDVTIGSDFEKAQNHDSIENTIDYSEIADILTKEIQIKKYQLIETMAEDMCSIIFKRWEQASACSIKIKKPSAVPSASFAAVKVERKRIS